MFFGMFDFVHSKIDSVYKDLTRSDRFPMGGSASIVLPNRDDPFSGPHSRHIALCALMLNHAYIRIVHGALPEPPPLNANARTPLEVPIHRDEFFMF